jgi:hypothetical protein
VHAVEQWLDEGWSPWRIGVGSLSLVSLGVTVFGYAAHPHHPGSVWWILGAAVVIIVWLLSEMLRWRVRHNRLRAQLNALLKDDQRELGRGQNSGAPNLTPTKSALLPLVPHYDQSPPYRRPNAALDEYLTEHRIGISNPAGNPVVTGVKLVWTHVSPEPRVADPGRIPALPHAVPRDRSGDPTVGIDLPPGQQELWVALSTWIGPDGVMAAGEFAREYGTSHGGKWGGAPYMLHPGDRFRFTYQIIADGLPRGSFSIVMVVAANHIRCDLEG